MNNNLKKLFVLVMAFCLLISATACISEEEPAATASTTTAATTVSTTVSSIDYSNRLVICDGEKSNFVVITPSMEESAVAADAAAKVLGDFNQTPDSGIFKTIKNSYIVNTAKDAIITTQQYDFDNIVLYDEMVTRNTRVIKTGHSDHYMLLTDWII